MIDRSVRFTQLDDLTPGITELHCEALGLVTYIGRSKEGDAVVQDGDNFTTVPEVTWNLFEITRPFEPETHVRYLSEESLSKFHVDYEKFLQLDFSDGPDMIYKYQATIHIKQVYDKIDS